MPIASNSRKISLNLPIDGSLFFGAVVTGLPVECLGVLVQFEFALHAVVAALVLDRVLYLGS